MASQNNGGKRKSEANDQFLNGFKQIALTPYLKNSVDHYRNLPRIPKFPWSECFQSASALVNFKDEKILLNLFTHFLTLTEALRLGRTCRRMYHFYQRSCTENRKSLVLVVDRSNAIRAPNLPLVSYAVLFEGAFITTADSARHFSAGKPHLTNRLDYRTTYGDLPLHSLHQLLTVTLPSLTYLEISASMGLPNLPDLCSILQRGCFAHLRTLKLYLCCADIDLDDTDRSMLPRNSAYCQLHLPHLKHLTLVLLHGQLIYHDGETVAELLGSKVVKTRTKTYSPLTIRCGLLSSFHLSTADALPRLCSLIHQYVLLSRLQHGMSEGNSNDNSGNYIQIAYHFRSAHTPELRKMLKEPFSHLQRYAPALAFITQVQMQPRYLPPLGFCIFLKLMTRLRMINFWAGSTAEDATTYYPTVLCALSTLPALTHISVDFTGFGEYAHCIAYSPLPVLPSVTELELLYPICSVDRAPLQQANIVEQLQLMRCFPQLTSLKVHFEQLNSPNFGRGFGRGENELIAARALVRGLSQLPLQPEKKEVIFTFRDKRFTIFYTSADNNVLLIQ